MFCMARCPEVGTFIEILMKMSNKPTIHTIARLPLQAIYYEFLVVAKGEGFLSNCFADFYADWHGY